VLIVEGKRAVLEVNLGRPIVTNGAFAPRSSQIILRTCFDFGCFRAMTLSLLHLAVNWQVFAINIML